jgi:hypothetical protein
MNEQSRVKGMHKRSFTARSLLPKVFGATSLLTSPTVRALEKAAVQAISQNPRYAWDCALVKALISEIIESGSRFQGDINTTYSQLELHDSKTIVISIVSKEYLNLGANWVRKISNLGIRGYILICGDKESYEYFSERDSPAVLVDVPTSLKADGKRNFAGFTEKALLLTSIKFVICEQLLRKSHHVIFSDIDAFWLQNPIDYLETLPSDFSFQSVVQFPIELVNAWGFAACSGFFFLRDNRESISLCKKMTYELLNTPDDQIAMNLALARSSIDWSDTQRESVAAVGEDPDTLTQRLGLSGTFFQNVKAIRDPVLGQTRDKRLRIAALPQTQFRRHLYMDLPAQEAWILHPNSPKDEHGKLEVFRGLGIDLQS